jgi:hypothetical protein
MNTPKVRWIHGAPDCSASRDPVLQVHRFERDMGPKGLSGNNTLYF